MAENLGESVLDLSTDDSGLRRGLSKAEGTARSKSRAIGKTIAKGVAAGVAGLAAVGAAAVTGAVKIAAQGDALDKTSSKLGIHTDFLQDAEHWASQNGIAAESMERGVGRLNQRIGRAIDGNDKYAEAFENVGVALTDTEGKTRDTESVMRETIDALGSIEDPAERSAKASEIFGTKMARDLMPALEDGSLSLEDATKAMDEHGRMSEEQIAQAVEFTDSWDNIKTAGMALLRDGLTPVMGFLADRVFPFIQSRVIPALKEFGEWIGPKLKAATSAIVTFFETRVVPTFQRLSAWWAENGPAIIATAQQLWDKITEVFNGIVAVVGPIIAKIVGWIEGFGESNSETGSWLAEIWGTITDIFASAFDAITAVTEVVVATLQQLWDRWGESILGMLSGVWEGIKKIIGGVLDIIRGAFELIAGVFTGDWSRAWEGIKQIFGGVWDAIVGILEGALSILLGLGEIIWEGLKTAFVQGRDAVVDAFTDMKDMAIDKAEELLDFVKSIPGRILDAIGDLGSLLLDVGRDIIQGLIDGIGDMFGGVRDTLGSLTSSLTSWKGPQSVDRKLLAGPAEDIMGDKGFAGHLAAIADRDVQGVLGEVTRSINVEGDVGSEMASLRDMIAGQRPISVTGYDPAEVARRVSARQWTELRTAGV